MALMLPSDAAISRTLALAEPSAVNISALLPGYQAYARVFSPARDTCGVRATWSTLAGSTMHPGVQWNELESAGFTAPDEGTIDRETAAELIELLRPRTTTPSHCVFLVWVGYGALKNGLENAPTVQAGAEKRVMYVLEGSLVDALENVENDPSDRLPLWWLPFDGAWSVAGDLYGRSVYVGGARDTVRVLTHSSSLEALGISPDYEVGSEDS